MIICVHYVPQVSDYLKQSYNYIWTGRLVAESFNHLKSWLRITIFSNIFLFIVKGVMTCDFGLHRTCGFDGADSSAQFMWMISRNRSDDYLLFPGLKKTGNITEDR